MTGAAGGHQRTMHRIGPIVDQGFPRQRRQRAAGFVHQKVSRRKVPVVAVGSGEGAVDARRSRRAPAATPARERAAPFRCAGSIAASASRRRFAPAEFRARQVIAGARPDRRTIERRAGARDRQEQFVGHRRIERPDHRTAVARPARRKSPIRAGRRDRRGCRRSDRRPRHAASAGARDRPRSPPRASRNHPAVSSRSRSSASTARSASLTGDDLPLIQLLSCAAKGLQRERAGFPHGIGQKIARARMIEGESPSGNGQALHAHGRRIGAVAELEIVRRRQRARTCRSGCRQSSPRSPDSCARRSRSRIRRRRGCNRRSPG